MLPQLPDQSSPLSRIPQQLGRQAAVRLMAEAGGDRVAVYGIENHAGLPVYVHAKVCVMDDCWATIGSDNFNRRSWTHDSELSAVVIDTSGGDHAAYARRLRLTLAAEHLDREVDDATRLTVMADCVEPHGMFAAYASRRRGSRPGTTARRWDRGRPVDFVRSRCRTCHRRPGAGRARSTARCTTPTAVRACCVGGGF